MLLFSKVCIRDSSDLYSFRKSLCVCVCVRIYIPSFFCSVVFSITRAGGLIFNTFLDAERVLMKLLSRVCFTSLSRFFFFSVTHWPRSCSKIPMCGLVSIRKSGSLGWRFLSLSLATGLQLLYEKKKKDKMQNSLSLLPKQINDHFCLYF